jgi:hypothetical protein
MAKSGELGGRQAMSANFTLADPEALVRGDCVDESCLNSNDCDAASLVGPHLAISCKSK